MQTPAALAPEPGGIQQIGEASLAAEAFGVHPGMRLGEALARCPRLMLVPPDPAGVADFWERLLVRLESIGAAVEPERPGLVCFDAARAAAPARGLEGVLGAARRALRDAGSLWRGPVAVCRRGGSDQGAGAPSGDRAAAPPLEGAAPGIGPAPIWLRCRSRCCAPVPRWPICRMPSSGWG